MWLEYDFNEQELCDILNEAKSITDTGERREYVHQFCKYLWSYGNTRTYRTKKYEFKVLSMKDKDVEKLFQKKHSYKMKDFKTKRIDSEYEWVGKLHSALNNIYNLFFEPTFDADGSIRKANEQLRNLYYECLKNNSYSYDEVKQQFTVIDSNVTAVYHQRELKCRKMTWSEYVRLFEEFLNEIIPRYKDCNTLPSEVVEEMELRYLKKYKFQDTIDESEVAIAYLKKSFKYFLIKKFKEQDGLKATTINERKRVRRCERCGKYIVINCNKQKYCKTCKKEVKNSQNKASYYRLRKIEK